MPRPQKVRRICSMPRALRFGPLEGKAGKSGTIDLTMDEYECIRLMDHLGCSQEECAVRMGVARTTVQAVYNSARQKLADLLVNGRRLTISGGCYRLCDRTDCCGRTCTRRRCDNRCCEGGHPGSSACCRPKEDPPKEKE